MVQILFLLITTTVFAQYNNTNVRASQSGSWDINAILNPVAVTMSAPPIGGATSANQALTNARLASNDATVAAQTPFLTSTSNGVGILVDTTKQTIQTNGTGTGAAIRNTLVGGVYKLAPQTLVDLDQSELILDNKGNLKVKVDGTVSTLVLNTGFDVNNFPVLQNITGSVTVSNFPAASSATSTLVEQQSQTTLLNNINNKTPALGQSTMLASSPVVIASNQSAIPVTGAFFQATQPVSVASLPLPLGAATETTLNTLLKPANTLAGVTTVGSVTSITNPVTVNTHAVTQSGVWNVGLSTGSNVIGSISNAGFNITGTLPAFAVTPTFNIGSGAFVDRTLSTAPYSQRLTDGTSFYDARLIRALTSADVVTIANPTTSVSVLNFPATQAISAASLPLAPLAATSTLQSTIDASINTLLKPASTLSAVTTVGTITNPVTVNAGTNTSTALLSLESTQLLGNTTLTNILEKFPSVLSNDRMKVETFPLPNDLGVTAVGAAAAAVTLTIPAVVAQFHYIDSIEITLYSTAARAGAAAPITCTTTNLNGAPAYTWATAAAIGTADTRQLHNANRPIKSLVANTVTTIVCPAVVNGLWRMNVRYSRGL